MDVGRFRAFDVCGIFTLALIPLVAERAKVGLSIYDVIVQPRPLLEWAWSMKLKCVCWPQHVAFLVGICVYAFGSAMGERRGTHS